MSTPVQKHNELNSLAESLKVHCRVQNLSGRTCFFRNTNQDGAPATEPTDKAALLEDLRTELGECTRCGLSAGRKSIVFGEGNPYARLVFVGEAPGADEDVQGRPFVGKAGQLLTRIIEAIKMGRSEVYIANVIKCRPPSNRDPAEDEIATCIPFLHRQLEIIQPQIICTLGRIAAQALLQTDAGITKLRGRFHRFGSIPVMPTYHPSYLLRTPARKKETWIDVQMIQEALR